MTEAALAARADRMAIATDVVAADIESVIRDYLTNRHVCVATLTAACSALTALTEAADQLAHALATARSTVGVA